MAVHTSHLSTREAEQAGLCRFKDSLVYIVGFRSVRDILILCLNKQTSKTLKTITKETDKSFIT